jgi:hypothetical protein
MMQKKNKRRPMYQQQLARPKVIELCRHVDYDLAQQAKEKGCRRCGCKVHQAHYARKPKGGPPQAKSGVVEEERRYSYCCGQEGCRRRLTPPSVRFLGRRVYLGVVVVLVSALTHGLSPGRVQRLREALGIDGRTLKRWRQWWLEQFVHSPFWSAVRSRFLPPLCEQTLPLELCEHFQAQQQKGLLQLLQFLSPITTQTAGTTGYTMD